MKKLILMLALLLAGFITERAFEKKQLDNSNNNQSSVYSDHSTNSEIQ